MEVSKELKEYIDTQREYINELKKENKLWLKIQ